MKNRLMGIVALLFMLMSMTVLAQDYSPTKGDGLLSFEFSKIYGGTVGSSTTFEREDVLYKDYPAVKLTPTPETAQGSHVTLDSWTLAAFGTKVEVPKYRYVGIKYYYETEAPTYKGKLSLSVLPGNTQAVQHYITDSVQPIVTNNWTEAVFDLTGMVINQDSSKPWINQIHFRPFGNTAPHSTQIHGCTVCFKLYLLRIQPHELCGFKYSLP